MAFLEGKLQPIDLLAALQARRQFEQTSEQRRQQELQNKLMQEQLEAAEWANLKAKERPTITLPAGPGLGGMREKQFLDQQAGYISGVSPTDTFNQWQQNFRTGMTAGGGGYGGRGGYGGGGQQAPPESPYSYIGPDHSVPQDSVGAANRLAELYTSQQSNLGGGGISDPATWTYKEFSQNPTMPVGKFVTADGGETVTGPAAAADYQSGLAGKAEVENILKGRDAVPGKQAEAKAQVLNNAAKSLSSDPRFKVLDEEIKNKILANIGTIVEDNIKTNGTPILEVGDVIKNYGK